MRRLVEPTTAPPLVRLVLPPSRSEDRAARLEDHRWQRSLAEVLAARLGVDPARDLRPELLAAAALAALDVASRRWLASDGHAHLATLLDESFAVLARDLRS